MTLNEMTGTPISRSAPVVMAERLSDGLAMLLLAATGVAANPRYLLLFFVALGLLAGGVLVIQIRPLAVFILSFATVVGALSALPGGLGAAEASVGAMLGLVVGPDRSLAGTATLLIRFCTLWFAVLWGLMVLIFFRRRLFPEGRPALET
jgi:uncharacterized membrane protein YbhN (UPF0104 family)